MTIVWKRPKSNCESMETVWKPEQKTQSTDIWLKKQHTKAKFFYECQRTTNLTQLSKSRLGWAPIWPADQTRDTHCDHTYLDKRSAVFILISGERNRSLVFKCSDDRENETQVKSRPNEQLKQSIVCSQMVLIENVPQPSTTKKI